MTMRWADNDPGPPAPSRPAWDEWLLWLLVPGVWLALTLAWIYWHRDALLLGFLLGCGVAGWLIVNGRAGV